MALIGALLLAIGQVRRTLVPLQALTGATQRLAARDFSSRVTVSADNEFAVLGEAFNDMADGLSRQFATLEALAAIDRVILEGQSLRTVGEVALDLMARRLSTPVFGLALDDGASTGWCVRMPASVWQRLPEDVRGAGSPGARGDLIEWPIGPPSQALLDALCADPQLRSRDSIEARAPQLDRLAEHLPALHLQGIVADGRTVGTMIVGWPEPLAPSTDERELMSALAARIAVAVAASARQRLLHQRAHFDSLTGLPNRPYFLEQLDQHLARAATSSRWRCPTWAMKTWPARRPSP